MSSAVKSVSESRLEARAGLGFDVLFGIVPLLLIAPLLAVEFQSLWQRTAMMFFPIPIFVVASFAFWHLRSPRSDQPLRVLLARGLFLVGGVLFGAAVWNSSPLCAHGSFILLFSGWAIERLGTTPLPRLLGWTALLATSMRLPGGLQTRLQEWLVQQSSAILGCILDGLAIPHLMIANSFSMRGLEFSLSECCTSMYSVNALACVVTLILLLTHRSLIVAFFSLLTVPLWAIVQQVLLLLAIVLLQQFSDRDASQGLDHALVELAVFLVVAGCCWATVWFLAKLFLPVPAADSQFEPEFLILNSMVCWPQPDPFAAGRPPGQPADTLQHLSMTASFWMQRLSWVGAVGLVAIGLLSAYRVVDGRFTPSNNLPPVHSQQLASTEWKELFPEFFERWRRIDATHQIQRFDDTEHAVIVWRFAWEAQIVQLSVTLPFKSRPRLASKYEALGWRILTEQAKQYAPSAPKTNDSTAENQQPPAPKNIETWTELKISNELGGQAHALVAYHPLEQKSSTATQGSDSAQPYLEYQVVLFCESGEALTVLQLSELYSGFYKANAYLRTEVEPSLRELLGGAQ